MEPETLYEDKDLIAVVKPAGLVVHGVRVGGKLREGEPTLVDWLLKNYPEIKKVGDDLAQRPGIVHRLDKETSGVMVVARTQAAFEHLKFLFMAHRVEKTYCAIVFGVPKDSEGVIAKPIGIRSGTLKRSVRSDKMQKAAVTAYRVVKIGRLPAADGKAATFSLLEIQPQTGRTHQIRVHLASIGHPVVGDSLYGPKRQPAWVGRLMLHARALELPAPSGGKLRFEVECPFKELLSD